MVVLARQEVAAVETRRRSSKVASPASPAGHAATFSASPISRSKHQQSTAQCCWCRLRRPPDASASPADRLRRAAARREQRRARRSVRRHARLRLPARAAAGVGVGFRPRSLRRLPRSNDRRRRAAPALARTRRIPHGLAAWRAGTTTPFSFGETIDTRQAKYDGQHPCGYGAQGKHRQTIVPVKRFPVNAWGLYEMHDKVWERCADGQRPRDGADCDDPRAPEGEGDYWRVARGGSWLSRAWRLGLACRFEGHRDGRDGFLGFSLRPEGHQPVGPARSAQPEVGDSGSADHSTCRVGRGRALAELAGDRLFFAPSSWRAVPSRALPCRAAQAGRAGSCSPDHVFFGVRAMRRPFSPRFCAPCSAATGWTDGRRARSVECAAAPTRTVPCRRQTPRRAS